LTFHEIYLSVFYYAAIVLLITGSACGQNNKVVMRSTIPEPISLVSNFENNFTQDHSAALEKYFLNRK